MTAENRRPSTTKAMDRADAFAAACRDGFSTRPACRQLDVRVGLLAGVPRVLIRGPGSYVTFYFHETGPSPFDVVPGVRGDLAYFHDAGAHAKAVIAAALQSAAAATHDTGAS